MDKNKDIQKQSENVSKDVHDNDASFDTFSGHDFPETELPDFDNSFATESPEQDNGADDAFFAGIENDDLDLGKELANDAWDTESTSTDDAYPFETASTPSAEADGFDILDTIGERPNGIETPDDVVIEDAAEQYSAKGDTSNAMFAPEGMEAEFAVSDTPESSFTPMSEPEDLSTDFESTPFVHEEEFASQGGDELSLEVADEGDLAEDESFDAFGDLPDLVSDSSTQESSEAKYFRDTTTLATDELYKNVLHILVDADDMGVDAAAKARINDAMRKRELAPVTCRTLISQRVITSIQLARAVARAQKRKEITNFLNVPHEAMALRTSLDRRVCALLREARVIPLWHRVSSEDDELQGHQSELHLAHESSSRDLVLESALSEYLPDHKFTWHFAMRDVCGAFWLSGDNDDVDASMEAEALLDRIVGNAIDARSSDIHVDPSVKGEFKAIVKYRVDGFVQSKEVITLDQLERLRVRIENIARMPKVDLHHPNKGAFSRSGFDWRVQIQPHAGRQGPLPRIVIRRLQPDVLPMEVLGYPEYFIKEIKKATASSNGVVFWTGPTGSGKTESIHSAIVSSNPMERGLSVHTIEDPPEKRVAGYAVQMEMSDQDPARSGLELLKSSLRADPDVIVFGEVRDQHMAELVFEAANTGHLVFTTLHTNTSLDAIVRLDELGIYGFNISYVRGIAAQRLVRRLCTHCRQPVSRPDEYTEYVFDKFGVELEGSTLFTHDPNGCPSCNYTGYSGRIAIAEWLVPNKELVDASTERDYINLEAIARRAGWKPMGYMGVLHVKNGITDVAELSNKVQELAGDI